jgi:hypothetical protein
MAIVWDKVRSRTRRRAGAQAPAPGASIREVCLVGVRDPGAVGPRGATWEDAWTAGSLVTWSGRTYQVKAAQAGAAAGPFGYVHLSALPED